MGRDGHRPACCWLSCIGCLNRRHASQVGPAAGHRLPASCCCCGCCVWACRAGSLRSSTAARNSRLIPTPLPPRAWPALPCLQHLPERAHPLPAKLRQGVLVAASWLPAGSAWPAVFAATWVPCPPLLPTNPALACTALPASACTPYCPAGHGCRAVCGACHLDLQRAGRKARTAARHGAVDRPPGLLQQRKLPCY